MTKVLWRRPPTDSQSNQTNFTRSAGQPIPSQTGRVWGVFGSVEGAFVPAEREASDSAAEDVNRGLL